VHIRDMRSIVECLAEHAATVTDPAELARRIRVHLAPSIVQQIYGPAKELDVIALEPELERLVTHALHSPHGAAPDPGVAAALSTKPSAQGIEVLAMAPEGMRQVERLVAEPMSPYGADSPMATNARLAAAAARPRDAEPARPAGEETNAEEDADRLSMSTL